MSNQTGYEIDIRIDDERWHTLKTITAKTDAAINAAIQFINPRPFSELSIALLDDNAVRRLNQNYRGQDKPTNVLSFPTENSELLGDIVLAYETVAREADEKHIALSAHFQHLLVHGFYHLQGYDHGTDQDAAVMESLESAALKSLGLDSPYAIKDES